MGRASPAGPRWHSSAKRVGSAGVTAPLPSGRPRARLGPDGGAAGGLRWSPPATTSARPIRPACRSSTVRCDIFITEATFGLPVFRIPDREEIEKLLASVAPFPERAHLVGAYALGKAQRVIALLREAGYDEPIYCTAPWSALRASTRRGNRPRPRLRRPRATGPERFAGRSSSARRRRAPDRWSRRFPDPCPPSLRVGCGCGRGRASSGVELPLIISDHADWDELLRTIDDFYAAGSLGDPRPGGGARALVPDATGSRRGRCTCSATATRRRAARPRRRACLPGRTKPQSTRRVHTGDSS